MLRISKYLKPFIFMLFSAFALLFIQAMCDLSLPDYMSDIINKGIVESNMGYIGNRGVVMLGISIVGAVCTITVGFLSARIAAGLARDLRKYTFAKVESFSMAEFDKFSTASLITRTGNDITQIQNFFVMFIRMVCYAPIMGIGGIIKAVDKSPSMTWTIGIAVVALIGMIALIFSIALPKFKMIQTLIDRINLIARENLSGMLVIRAFNTQKFEEARFDVANKELTDTNLFVNRMMSLLMPAMMLIMNLTSILIVWVGANKVSQGTIGIGDMMAYMQYGMQVIMAFLFMAVMFIMIPRAAVSADRIADVLETVPAIQDPELPLHFPHDFKGVVEYKDVCFKYPGAEENVLHNINFTAKPGETTAFIGSTGSGKTSIVHLLTRFYDVTGGKVTVDGVDVKEVTQHELRSKIGYVPQRGILFSGTIDSNMHYADENATKEEIESAAEIAQAMNFINEKPDKFDTEISQGGTNVSGGQRQRLSIARALVKRPQIYIFDDTFSALDFKTDQNLRHALKQQTGNSTVLLIAQRISTIMTAEQIIVLEGGKIVGMGKHSHLMKSCSVYKEIALSQLSEAELAEESDNDSA